MNYRHMTGSELARLLYTVSKPPTELVDELVNRFADFTELEERIDELEKEAEVLEEDNHDLRERLAELEA